MGQHPGLARPGPGDDQQRAVAVERRPPAARGSAPRGALRAPPPVHPTDGPRHPTGRFWPPIRRPGAVDRRPEREMEQTPHGAQPLASPPVADGRIARLRGRVTEGAEWAATTAWHPVVIARAAYERDRDIGGGLLAGAIAFRLFVWLAAFLVVTCLDPRVHRRRRGRRRGDARQRRHHRHRRRPDHRGGVRRPPQSVAPAPGRPLRPVLDQPHHGPGPVDGQRHRRPDGRSRSRR